MAENNNDNSGSKFTRDLLSALLSRAGRGKDEAVEILGREIGQAIAAMLKRPLSEVFRNNRVQLTIELVPKNKLNQRKKT